MSEWAGLLGYIPGQKDRWRILVEELVGDFHHSRGSVGPSPS